MLEAEVEMYLVMVMMLACGGDGPDKDLETDTDTYTDTDQASDTGTSRDPGEATCPWAGEWYLHALDCGSLIAHGYDAVLLDMRHGSGGCEITLTLESDECRETEELRVAPAWPATTVELESLGVTECAPSRCTHDAAGDDRACEEGDRAGEVRPFLVQSSLDGLQALGEWAHLHPRCGTGVLYLLPR